jgi:hypothetical protein
VGATLAPLSSITIDWTIDQDSNRASTYEVLERSRGKGGGKGEKGEKACTSVTVHDVRAESGTFSSDSKATVQTGMHLGRMHEKLPCTKTDHLVLIV